MRKSPHFLFYHVTRRSPPQQCNMSSSCSSAHAKNSHCVRAKQALKYQETQKPNQTCISSPPPALQPCCKDFRTCGYLGPRGSAWPHFSPSVTSPKGSSSTDSCKTKTLTRTISDGGRCQLTLSVVVERKQVFQDKSTPRAQVKDNAWAKYLTSSAIANVCLQICNTVL